MNREEKISACLGVIETWDIDMVKDVLFEYHFQWLQKLDEADLDEVYRLDVLLEDYNE